MKGQSKELKKLYKKYADVSDKQLLMIKKVVHSRASYDQKLQIIAFEINRLEKLKVSG